MSVIEGLEKLKFMKILRFRPKLKKKHLVKLYLGLFFNDL